MASYILTPAAEDDLSDIWDYTVATWGEIQGRQYVQEIRFALEMLAEHPLRGRGIDEVRRGYRKYPVGSHVIFYRFLDDAVDVARILHRRMDSSRYLG